MSSAASDDWPFCSTESLPGGVRGVLAENLIAAMLDLELASGNDAMASHSQIRKAAKLMLQFLPGTDFVGALALAERLRDGVAREPFPTGQGGPVAVTVSVGCTTTHGDDPEDLIRRADAALRSAKQGGRDRVAYL